MKPFDIGSLRRSLVSAATEYDRREETRSAQNPRRFHHNIYALPQYFAAIDAIVADIGSDGRLQSEPEIVIRAAIIEHTTGRLATALLKSVGQRAITRDEQRGGI